MGKKGGGSTVQAPDPYETSKAEAQFNRLDTYSPSGSGTRYGYTDASGNFVQGVAPKGYQSAQTYVESPYEKQIRTALEPASVDLVNRVIADNITGMPDAARAKDFSSVADQLYKAGYDRMKPTFEAENNRLLSNLQSRGLPIGSEAFNEAYAQQQQSVNDALTDLTTKATTAAGAEQSRQYQLDAAQRSASVAELVAAMGGSYNPPSSLPSGQAAGIDYSGLVNQKYQADVANANAQAAQASSTMGTLGQLGAAAIMKSDRRLKRDVRPIEQRGRHTLYEFRYLWDKPGTVRRGYMAQEVALVQPEAVVRDGAHFALDYSQLPEVA